MFYLLPTRAWELMMGGLAALYAHKITLNHVKRLIVTAIAIAVLIILPLYSITNSHPSIDALLITLATVTIIVCNPFQTTQTAPIRVLSKIGDFSYSLYLVHWPLYALTLNASMGGELPLSLRLSLLILSVILAVALYHWVENPIHRATFKNPRRFVYTLIIASISLMGLTMVGQHHFKQSNYKHILRANVGLSQSCDQKHGHYEALPECQTTENPRIMIWGDSLAMHFVEGLKSTSEDYGVIQATQSSCAPFPELSYYNYPKYTRDWAQKCIRFNEQVLEALSSLSSVDYVVLSGQFSTLIDPSLNGIIHTDKTDFRDIQMSENLAKQSLQSLANHIRAMGKKLIILSPPPTATFNTGQCLERRESGKFSIGHHRDCTIET